MAARILIAEDDESIAASLDFLMRRCGHETRIARDGVAAFEALGEFRPQLAILDLMLPRRSGLDLCRDIRAHADHRAMGVLLVTAKGGASERASGLAAGADDYLMKPFSTQDLVERVRRLLEVRGAAPGGAARS